MERFIDNDGFDGRHTCAYDLQDYVRVVQETRGMITRATQKEPLKPTTMAQRGFHGFDGRNMTADEAARMAMIRRRR